MRWVYHWFATLDCEHVVFGRHQSFPQLTTPVSVGASVRCPQCKTDRIVVRAGGVNW